MKKIAKVLSSVLAVSMLMSAFAVNSFAAGQHTVTVSADKTADIVAGDVITVSVTIDTNADISVCEYDLLFDKDVFSLDWENTTENEDEEISVPNYIDYDWFFDEETVYSNKWFNRVGDPSYNPNPADGYAKPGSIYFAVFGGKGVVTDKNKVENLCIGKFKFTVTDAVVAGADYVFTLSNASKTADANDEEALSIAVPVTVTAKAAAPSTSPDPTDPPATPDPTEDPATPTPEVNYIAPDNAVVNTGAVWTAETYTDIDTDANNYEIVFAANDGAKATFALDFGNIVTSGSATFDIVLRTAKTIVGYVINAIAK